MTTTTAPPTKFQPKLHEVTLRDVRVATWVCFFAWTFAVYDFVLFGNLLPSFAADMGWTEAQSTNINTWVTVGTALVAFGIGPIVDRIGRRKGIIISVIGAAVASGLTAVAGAVIGVSAGIGIVFLLLVRSLAGLGYGEQALNATYLNELFAKVYQKPEQARRRGFIYSLVQSGWPIGSVIAAASVYLLFPIGGWALTFVVAIFPAIFIAIAGLWLKESPQFLNRKQAMRLLKEGREEEAREFAKLAGVSIAETSAPLSAVFKGESLRAVLFIGLGFMLSWFGVLVFVILGTSMLTSASGKGIDFSDSMLILMISNGTAFFGYLFHGWLGDRIGRRNTISIGWMLAAISFALMVWTPSENSVLIIVFYSAGLFFLIGPFAALLFFNGESFPVHTRATGGAIINALGQVGAVITGVLVTISLESGMSWNATALCWGVIPTALAAVILLGAKNVRPTEVRVD